MATEIYAKGEHNLVELTLKSGAKVVFTCLDVTLKDGQLEWTHAGVEPDLISVDPDEIVAITLLKTVITRKGNRLRKRAEKRKG